MSIMWYENAPPCSVHDLIYNFDSNGIKTLFGGINTQE